MHASPTFVVITALLASLLATAVSDPQSLISDAPPVALTLYYESRCPYCVEFITQQLLPVYNKLGDTVMNIALIPYGHAVPIVTPWNRTDYVCQHGEAECLGNNMHACFLLQNAGQSQNTTINFAACLMNNDKYPSDLVRECGDKLSIDWHPVEQCANDQHVYPSYIDVFGKKTEAVQPPVTGVPLVTIDGVQNFDAPDNLLPIVCAAYKGSKPAACN